MKRFLSFSFLILLLSSLCFAQSEGYRGQRKTVDNITCKVTRVTYSQGDGVLDIYFSSAVDPRTVNANTVFIDSSSIGNSKITFNRDGTQARIMVKKSGGFTVKISGVKSYEGEAIAVYSKKIE